MIGDYGFLDFGVVKIESSGAARESFLEYLGAGENAGMEYLARNLEKRFNPALLVDGAESILCFLAPYGPASGGVAGFACGIDYHKVVKDRLFGVMNHLAGKYAGFVGRAFVDSAPVMERFWARRASLGFIGENGFLISPKWGLRTIIGTIICNVPAELFEPHPPLEIADCGSCGRCRDACPNGALKGAGRVDARLCTSYHTIEVKELYDIHPVNYCGWIFGCEECLKACPWNREVPSWPEFEVHRKELETMSAEDWNRMEKKDFDATFSDSGLTRAGLEKIRNNL